MNVDQVVIHIGVFVAILMIPFVTSLLYRVEKLGRRIKQLEAS